MSATRTAKPTRKSGTRRKAPTPPVQANAGAVQPSTTPTTETTTGSPLPAHIAETARAIYRFHTGATKNMVVAAWEIGRKVDEFCRKTNESEADLEALSSELQRLGIAHLSPSRLLRFRSIATAFTLDELTRAVEAHPNLAVDSLAYIATRPEPERKTALQTITSKRLSYREVQNTFRKSTSRTGIGGRKPKARSAHTLYGDLRMRCRALATLVNQALESPDTDALQNLDEDDTLYGTIEELVSDLDSLISDLELLKSTLESYL